VSADEPFLVFGAPVIGQAEIDEVVDSLRSGWVGTGPKVARLERMLETYLGVAHVRCVSSCTAALMLSMRALGIGSGDEVILPSMTFVATANAVEQLGATPVLVDSADEGGLLSLEATEAAITARTAAIIPVHLAGQPCDLGALRGIAERRGLALIEDAAHAIGASWRGSPVGAHGNTVAFSFYVTKNMTTIEGGAIATADADVAEKVERLALHGLSAGAWQRYSDAGFRHYEVVEPGFKFNMTDVQAAVGIHQLPQLDGWAERRRVLWDAYDRELAGLPLRLPRVEEHDGTVHARHLYRVESHEVDRDELIERLIELGIGTGVHYRAVHLHPYYRDRYGLHPGDFPHATRASDTTLSLPLAGGLTDADQERAIAALRTALARG
jgi:dTDP-4-amino-4,6-dideoxygalactose transaminase